MNYPEAQLEKAFAELLGSKGFPHCLGESISRVAEWGELNSMLG